MEAKQALEAPDISKPVLQLEILTNRTNSAEKESPEMALETSPLPMAVQIMVSQRISEKAQHRYDEHDLDGEEYLNEFKQTINSRNNAKEATRNADKFNKTIKSKHDQDLSDLLSNPDPELADDDLFEEDEA